MTAWDNRSNEVADYFNPAFCAAVIAYGVQCGCQSQKSGVSFLFPFLLLPLVLHEETRTLLKTTKSSSRFLDWIVSAKNAKVKIGFSKRAKMLVPYVKEGMIFAVGFGLFSIEQDGTLRTQRELPKSAFPKSDDVLSILRSTEKLARLFCSLPEVSTLLPFLGVTP